MHPGEQHPMQSCHAPWSMMWTLLPCPLTCTHPHCLIHPHTPWPPLPIPCMPSPLHAIPIPTRWPSPAPCTTWIPHGLPGVSQNQPACIPQWYWHLLPMSIPKVSTQHPIHHRQPDMDPNPPCWPGWLKKEPQESVPPGGPARLCHGPCWSRIGQIRWVR